MSFLLRMPLHYQILIAMVLGTVIGLVVNPGDMPLRECPSHRGTHRRRAASA